MRAVITRRYVLILAMMALCSGIAQGTISKGGIFDINGPSALSFDLVPWASSNPYVYTYLWPFATDNLYAGGPGSLYNLAQVRFSSGSFNVTDYDEKNGDLGVRIGNYSGGTQTFEACILTLDFIDEGCFNIYLPEFTFNTNENIFFWVTNSGATYYANSLKGTGYPDISADIAIAAGDEYLAMAPEPATFLLLGLGTLMLRRKN